jgi:glucose uptake protein
VSGILMGSFYPVLEMSKHEFGLGPYAAVFVFSAGILLSTPFFNIFFMNVPVQGDPVGFGAYFKGKFKYHVLGLLGGIIWCVGMTANFVAASTSKAINVGPAVSYAIGQGATLVSTLWGLLVWHEFKGAVPRTRSFVALMLALFVAGLGLIAVAPLFKQ